MKFVSYCARVAVSLPLVIPSLAFGAVPNPYGAIAYSAVDGKYGIAVQNEELEVAMQKALGQCTVQLGGKECKIVVAFADACAALAIGENRAWGAAMAATTRNNLMPGINLAYRTARLLCVGRGGGDTCRLEQAVCSFSAVDEGTP